MPETSKLEFAVEANSRSGTLVDGGNMDEHFENLEKLKPPHS
jgi:hypothetical protein